MKMKTQNELQQCINKFRGPVVPGVNVTVAMAGDVSEKQFTTVSSGNILPDGQYFIASATKLYVTALYAQMQYQQKLKFDDKISRYLSADVMKGLHKYKGFDSSDQLTIRHLLSHTSGLTDYFQVKRKDGTTLLGNICKGRDQKWSFDDVIADAKSRDADFLPSSGKALYSDTNFQLLEKILVNRCDDSLESILSDRIFKPLHLVKTYLYNDPADVRPLPLNYRKSVLRIPLAMSSFRGDGGIVSTSVESMIFLRAFFEGKLFPLSSLDELTLNWKRIFFPIQYATGVMKFSLPWFFSPFKKYPDLIGHSGLSGAFQFYCPQRRHYLTGTVNQVDRPDLSYRLMIKILDILNQQG